MGYSSFAPSFVSRRMPTLTIDYTTDAERIQLERAIAFVREMQHLGATAPHGTVLDACERFALDAGRKLLVEQLEAAVRTRAEGEKKVPAARPKGRRPAP
jgi:hypothetical protein